MSLATCLHSNPLYTIQSADVFRRVFLEFTSLVYKAMKLEEKRKKGKAKQQEETSAREIVQHPTSEAFATSTYHSPRNAAAAAVAPQALPLPQQQQQYQQAPAISAPEQPPPIVLQQPPAPRRQATINGMVIAPCSVSRAMPS